ncbi:RNA 2',3'-cyclic phosphodiesterase [Gemmobacter denitrificans]|uniref:RNA 2',3'-cyclic phosphodiesterase n=1 Tax=Gemmobacter denitrificans TaxID=3123040 RepID=A0ABU8BYE5_9RHOB
MIRSFIALPIPEDICQKLRLLQFLLPLPARVEPEDFHLTLAFLGDQPVDRLEEVHDGLERLAAPPFPMLLEGVGLFGGAKPRIAFAALPPNPALIHLQAKVARVAVAAGISIPARGFTPHVTLGRFDPPAPDAALRLERAVAAEQGFRAGPWLASELVLYASHPKAKGQRYERLSTYPLA